MGRILSIDYGLARLGLALSDERGIIASPFKVLPAEKLAAATALKLAQEMHSYSVAEIIIGYPLHLNGKKGLLADEVLNFVKQLKTHFSCPIHLWDERLSTLLATRALREGLSRKRASKVVDKVTAALLLQSYLESKLLAENSANTYLNP